MDKYKQSAETQHISHIELYVEETLSWNGAVIEVQLAGTNVSPRALVR